MKIEGGAALLFLAASISPVEADWCRVQVREHYIRAESYWDAPQVHKLYRGERVWKDGEEWHFWDDSTWAHVSHPHSGHQIIKGLGQSESESRFVLALTGADTRARMIESNSAFPCLSYWLVSRRASMVILMGH